MAPAPENTTDCIKDSLPGVGTLPPQDTQEIESLPATDLWSEDSSQELETSWDDIWND